MKTFDWTDAGAVVGIVAVAYGLHLAWPPLAWLFLGALAFFISAVASDAMKKKKK